MQLGFVQLELVQLELAWLDFVQPGGVQLELGIFRKAAGAIFGRILETIIYETSDTKSEE